jgi:hypothetical protein
MPHEEIAVAQADIRRRCLVRRDGARLSLGEMDCSAESFEAALKLFTTSAEPERALAAQLRAAQAS